MPNGIEPRYREEFMQGDYHDKSNTGCSITIGGKPCDGYTLIAHRDGTVTATSDHDHMESNEPVLRVKKPDLRIEEIRSPYTNHTNSENIEISKIADFLKREEITWEELEDRAKTLSIPIKDLIMLLAGQNVRTQMIH